MKTRKTASTSIQAALSKVCGDDDIITGTNYFDGIIDESHSAGRNLDKFFTNHPHPTARDVRHFIGNDIWTSYYKFGFVRNPYDIAASRYYWEKKGKYGNQKTSIDGFRKWVSEENLKNYDLQLPYLSDGYSLDMDFIGHYETLNEDFKYICKKLNIPEVKLEFQKSGYRDKIDLNKLYNKSTQKKVAFFFKDDILQLAYSYKPKFSVRKLGQIIFPNMFGGIMENNINGPSVIKVPDWIINPLGKYYMYFAHHQGQFIRLAYTDNIEGEWTVYNSGTLKLNQTICSNHIASPDVHIDNEKKEIIMYYHGLLNEQQHSFISISKDGLNFKSSNKILGKFYFRVFNYKDKYYAFAKNANIDGIFYESNLRYADFKHIFNFIENVRHSAVYVEDNILNLFYTIVGDIPEKIYLIRLNLDNWDVIDNQLITLPQFEYEGNKMSLVPSSFGSTYSKVNQLRDPYVFVEDDKKYLFYSVAGERGIAVAKLTEI